MRFRPCIDIHNGKVKQIVGSSLSDSDDAAVDNYVSELEAVDYARLYHQYGLKGGHIILLNAAGSSWYPVNAHAAKAALSLFPGTLQIGGGITPDTAPDYLDAGASHVIVTSYVFRDGQIDGQRLFELVHSVGKEHLVLDLSCRKDPRNPDGPYYITTDRWQKRSEVPVNSETLQWLSGCCDEFLIHAVDVEGKSAGIEKDLIRLLAASTDHPVTYAGGIRSMDDINFIKTVGLGKIDYTVGSALDLFGGCLPFKQLAAGDLSDPV